MNHKEKVQEQNILTLIISKPGTSDGVSVDVNTSKLINVSAVVTNVGM